MLSKPLREEQADMRSRWSDPSYQWANDSDLRRKYNARRKCVAVPNAVHQAGHIVGTALHSGSKETEVKGDKK
jgi:hypothetical protein